LLGIDGGGTKTVACLALGRPGESPRLLGRGRTGPGNPRAVGFDQALANIDAAIEAAFGQAAVSRGPAACACLAAAGTGREADRARVAEWAQQRLLARRIEVVNDAEPLLAAGTPEGWGGALIAGTGSFAYGRTPSGVTARTGGWGYLFGDEGSGYALALAGLRAAAQAADGRGTALRLLEQFQRRLDVARPPLLVEAIYRSDMDRRRIADLALVVLDTAAEGDAIARELIAGAARDLAQMVSVLSDKLGLCRDGLPLALAGSLLLGSPLVREQLVEDLCTTGGFQPRIAPVAEPVLGAVTLAHRLLTAS